MKAPTKTTLLKYYTLEGVVLGLIKLGGLQLIKIRKLTSDNLETHEEEEEGDDGDHDALLSTSCFGKHYRKMGK